MLTSVVIARTKWSKRPWHLWMPPLKFQARSGHSVKVSFLSWSSTSLSVLQSEIFQDKNLITSLLSLKKNLWLVTAQGTKLQLLGLTEPSAFDLSLSHGSLMPRLPTLHGLAGHHTGFPNVGHSHFFGNVLISVHTSDTVCTTSSMQHCLAFFPVLTFSLGKHFFGL